MGTVNKQKEKRNVSKKEKKKHYDTKIKKKLLTKKRKQKWKIDKTKIKEKKWKIDERTTRIYNIFLHSYITEEERNLAKEVYVKKIEIIYWKRQKHANPRKLRFSNKKNYFNFDSHFKIKSN